ncbi:helix-turn-helix domain-containing protein [Streptomyces sp. NPDC002057]|uniref:helix-turn-helix domain-containing protein n=1 Tax=Streptomyces sp. NPDC002057 TaxID=3154664 RepID=UPI003329B611
MTTHAQVQEHPSRPRTRSAKPTLPSPTERAALRRAWHLSERQVAEAFGVTATTVRSWEAGRTSPTGRRRVAYATFLSGLASGMASGRIQSPAHAPRAEVRDRSRRQSVDAPRNSTAPEVPGAPVPAQRVARRSVDLKGLSVGSGFDPVSPERRRRLRLAAAAVGVWSVALHLILTMPPPHL